MPSLRVNSERQSTAPNIDHKVTARMSAPRLRSASQAFHTSTSQRTCSSRLQPWWTSV